MRATAASSSRATTPTKKTTSTSMERVCFVGLGIMGAPMARNALKGDFPVVVTNRTPDRATPLAEAGATVVRSPREVAERSDIVVTMVTNTPDVEAVTFGKDGIAAGAHAELLAIDMSTISPAASRDFAERAAANHPPFRTLDAPVSGGEVGAIEARLAIMVGGDAADVRRAMPLFEALGKTIVHTLYTALQKDGGGRDGNCALLKVIERLWGREARQT